MDTKDPEVIRRDWLLQNEKVCICKGIPRKRFIAAIKNGAHSVSEINRLVGSGSGECRGERCGGRIAKLIAEYLAVPPK